MPVLRLLLLLPFLLLRHSPERARPAMKAAKPTLETDLETLADAANEAAKREAAQWFYFVTIMITLAAIIGSTTHRVLFLEEPVKVPLLSIDLPLVGFYWTAPVIFLVLHFYLLAQVREMRGKIAAFLDAVEQQANGSKAALRLALKRLDPFPVVTLLAAKRLGDLALPIRLMVWTTLAVAPLCLLLFVQIRFLPYHDPLVTWWHRMVLAADLAMLWWLWPRAAPLWYRWNWLSGVLGMVLSVAIISFAGLLATVPGEDVDRVAAWVPGQLQGFRPRPDDGPLTIFLLRVGDRTEFRRDSWQASVRGGFLGLHDPSPDPNLLPKESLVVALRRALFDGGVDADTQRPRSVFSRNLVLPDQSFLISEDRKAFLEDLTKAIANIPRTQVLRGRDLRGAVLDRADLSRADFTSAKLEGVHLSGAKLFGAHLDRAQLQGALLNDALLQSASLNDASLQGARLNSAQLQSAKLNGAKMQGARLNGAQLQGASLNDALMLGTRLSGAQLQGAWLDRVHLQGALLNRAQLQGAHLAWADLQGAVLDEAQLQGAWLNQAQLQGAQLNKVQMQGSSIRNVAVWRAGIKPRDKSIKQAEGIKLNDADLGHINFDPKAPRESQHPERTTWQHWIDAWRADVPEDSLRHHTQGILTEEDSDPVLEFENLKEVDLSHNPLRAAWPDLAQDRPPDPKQVAQRLASISCATEHAPYVARGILRQFGPLQVIGGPTSQKLLEMIMLLGNEVRDDTVGTLFARLLDPAGCPGVRGLTDVEREKLAQMAARALLPAPAPNTLGALP